MHLGQHLGQHAGQQLGASGDGAFVTAAASLSSLGAVAATGHVEARRSATISSTGSIRSARARPDPVVQIEDAIYRWVVAGSSLAESQVIWATVGGGGPQPAGLYISMRLLDIDSVSADWIISREMDGEIVDHVRGTRHPTLELRCYAGASYGPSRAEMVLARVLAAGRLPSLARILRAGGVGVGELGKVRVVPGSRSTMFDPLALVEVGLHITIDVAEVGQSIDSVELDLTPPGATLTVTRPEA